MNITAANPTNDVFFLYITPIICFFGLILNLLCIIVFSKKEFKEVLFKYFKMESIFVCFIFLIKCIQPIYYCNTCELSRSYFAQFFYKYFSVYLTSVFEMSAILCQICSASYCLNLIRKNVYNLNCSYILMAIVMIMVSGVVFLFQLFQYSINEHQIVELDANKTIYKTETYEIINLKIVSVIEIVSFSIRDGLLSAVLIVLNILLFVEIKRKMKQKTILLYSINTYGTKPTLNEENCEASLNNSSKLNAEKSKNRVSIMVVLSCLNCIIGRTPILLFFVLRNFIKDDLSVLLYFAIICIYLSYSLFFFLYYTRNKLFKKIFQDYLKIIKKKLMCF